MKFPRPNRWFVMLGCIWICGSAFAQSDEEEVALQTIYGDEDTVSIATGSKQSVAKTPAVTTVITAADIRAMHATDIDDVLETVPGLHVARNAFGYSPVYTFRGVYAQYNPQVLMLVNGIPLTNLFQGDRNLIWGGMPVNAIARIEVIRGPGSALYGADAFAGVINIITKTRTDLPEGEIGVRSGSFNTHGGWVLEGADIGDAQVAFMLEYQTTDGPKEEVDVDAQSGLDALLGTSASQAPGAVELSGKALDVRIDVALHNWKLRGGLQKRDDIGSGAGVADALDTSGRYGSERWNLDLSYDHFKVAKYWDASAQLSVLNSTVVKERNLQIFPPGVDLGAGSYPDGLIGNPEVYERHYRAEVATNYTGFERHQWRFGLGYYYGDMYRVRETKNYGLDPQTGLPLPSTSPVIDVSNTPYAFLMPSSRNNRHFYAQDIWNLMADWELTAGLRYDDFSDFGHAVNPRLALVWSTTRQLTSKLLFGRAFRSPSFAQLRNANNPAVLGNDKLDPETMNSLELAFDYRPQENLRMGFNVFHYEWDNIIQFVPEPNSTARRAQNSGKQTGDGGELELTWQPLPAIKVSGNYSYEKAQDKTLDAEAANAPQQKLYASVNWEFANQWQLHTQIDWVMDRQRDARDFRAPIDDYNVVDLGVRHTLYGEKVSVAGTVRNLFNSSPREPSLWSDPVAAITNDLPLARRNFVLELTYKIP